MPAGATHTRRQTPGATLLSLGVLGLLTTAAGGRAAEAREGGAGGRPAVATTLQARATAARHSSFQVDRSGERSPEGPEIRTRLRVGTEAHTGDVLGPLELSGRLTGEVFAGTVHGRPTLSGDDLPGARLDRALLREAWVQASVSRWLRLKVGAQTSHWGLGLVANDGDDTFGSGRPAWFSLPDRGDRVLRALLGLRPSPRAGSALEGLLLVVAADRVIEDDVARLAADEVATQGVMSARLGLGQRGWLGLYYVLRDQEHGDGKTLRGQVVDASLDLRFGRRGEGLRLQAETAAVLGRTTLAPSRDHPEHDLVRLAAAGRVSVEPGVPGLRFELDAAWLSGDGDLDDDRLSAFRADPGFHQGLLLFPRVLAWQTGRARLTASDPRYSGVPAEDLDLLASDGAVFGALTVFPKLGWQVLEGVEVYGGVLLAWATADVTDPFNSRTKGGGEPRNHLAGEATGRGLGTEVDIGVRARLGVPLLRDVDLALHLALEYGVLLPGAALEPDDGTLATVHGGRLTLALGP